MQRGNLSLVRFLSIEDEAEAARIRAEVENCQDSSNGRSGNSNGGGDGGGGIRISSISILLLLLLLLLVVVVVVVVAVVAVVAVVVVDLTKVPCLFQFCVFLLGRISGKYAQEKESEGVRQQEEQ